MFVKNHILHQIKAIPDLRQLLPPPAILFSIPVSSSENGSMQQGIGQDVKLLIIKIIHTLVWVFFNAVLFYLFYAGITGQITVYVWIGIGLFALEGMVLLLFNKTCPLTIWARKYSGSTRDNFDIFLPNWLARNNKLIYTILLAIAMLLLLYRLFEMTFYR